MDIKLFGDGVGENKVVFDRLLAKWNELFNRAELFDKFESVEEDKNGIITFSGKSSELSFYHTDDLAKAGRKDTFLSMEPTYLIGGSQSQDWTANSVIMTEIVYKADSDRQITFVFSSNHLIATLHIEFNDSERNTKLETKIMAGSKIGIGSEISLQDLLEALDKQEVLEYLEPFTQRIEENKERIQLEMQKDAEQEMLENLKPAFDALSDL